jgi:hypothetical protein
MASMAVKTSVLVLAREEVEGGDTGESTSG